MSTQVFLDANIWIIYCWSKVFSNKRSNKKRKCLPIHRFRADVRVTLTPLLIHEITHHFKDYFLIQQAIDDGYSIYEFSKVRRDYKLKTQDKKQIDKVYELVTGQTGLGCVKDQLMLDGISESTLSKTSTLINLYDFDFFDCSHVLSAKKHGCEIFVTNDTSLRKSTNNASKKYTTLKMDYITQKGFQKKYSRLFLR